MRSSNDDGEVITSTWLFQYVPRKVRGEEEQKDRSIADNEAVSV